MGDSACFMPPAFSYTSGVPDEAYQGNPVNALGESVSFGRFMTESLAWEKWSPFSNKRHVEEAKRCAQPGSVAQKIAFFEAHYKRIAAAKKASALLEQQNAATNALEQPEIETQEPSHCNITNQDSETIKQDSQEVVLEKNQDYVVSTDGLDANEKPEKSEVDSLDCVDLATEPEVSFGRFMTESLAWEKWSSFSNKRHVEEAERYAQPGSVAQKKAFLEAHYKRIAAAKKASALLEQQNAATNALEQPEIETQEPSHCNITNQDSETIKQDSQEVVLEKKQDYVVSTDGLDANEKPEKSEVDWLDCADLATEPEVLVEICPNVDKQNMVSGLDTNGTPKIAKTSVKDSEMIKQDSQEVVLEKNQDYVVSTDGLDANEKPKKSEVDWLNCADLATEPEVLVEICPNVDKQNMVSGLDTNGTPKIAKSSVKKNNSNHKNVSKSVSKKRPAFSSLRSSVFNKVASSPAKFVAPPLPRKEINNLTPRTIKSKMNFTDMKRSTPKPHRKSINFTTAAEPDTLSTLAIRKSEYSRNVKNSYKATKDFATLLQTPIAASVSKKPKHPSVTPSSVNKSCSKSFSACQKTLQSSTLSTPFLLRTELRAEKRKQRLEERFNKKKMEKVQMRTKSKEKSETIKQDSQEVVLEKNQDYVVSTDGLDANEKREKSEVDWLDCADLATEQEFLVEICPNVDKQNMVSGLDTNGTPKIAKSSVKKNSSNHKDVSKSVSKKRPVFSSLSASCSKSFSACQKTLQSSTLSTPFLLRTELRAEKRKQRLEERFNEKETEKVQMRTKSKEKSEAEVWKLRQSLCFRARPLPEFYRERKIQEMQNQSPKVDGKSCASTTEAKNPLTRSSTKNSAFKNVSEKNSQTPSRNLSLPALTPRKIHSKKLSTGQHKQH